MNEEMEVVKRSSKGGFLQLFDWNLKSRKKLLSNKSELPENGKHGKEYVDSLAISGIQQVHENGRVPESKAINDLHDQASLSASEEYGPEAKAPGVVARLMGLDSMPSSNACDYNSLSFEPQLFSDLDYMRSLNFHDEHHIVIYESTLNKANRMPKNPLELKLQKLQRPIERFQSEVLPSKTAKPVVVSHNRLMSPIKSPGFIAPKNAAFVMEAAARIIEQSPRSTAKGKPPSLVSSSATLRFQDLSEKMGAAKKPSSDATNLQNPTKYVRRQPREKGDVQLTSKASIVRQSLKTKDKSAPLSVKPKSTVQRGDGTTSFSRTSGNLKVCSETKPSYSIKNQPKSRKNIVKNSSSSRSTDALRQNNQKQNCMTSENEEGLRPSTSNRKDINFLSSSDITRPNKVVNKIIVNPTARSGVTNSMVVDSRRDSSEFKREKNSRKKLPENADIHSVKGAENRIRANSVKRNVSFGGRNDFDVVDKKNGLDVVSFTFTSPIKKSLPVSSSSTQSTGKNDRLCLTSGENDRSSKFSAASSSGINEVGGDGLSILLEQKLKELTSNVEDTLHHQVSEMTSTSSDQCNSCTDGIKPSAPEDWKGSEASVEHTSFRKDVWKRNFDFRSSSLVSSQKLSALEASFNSLDSNQSFISEGSKWCSSFENGEVSGQGSTSSSQITDVDLDLADSACSASAWSMVATDSTLLFTLATSKGSYNWELQYIKSIIKFADLMFEEFALGHVHRVMDPNLFDQLETHITESNKNLEEQFRVARRALFDCVEECLQSRCKRNFCGSFRAWSKWMAVFKRSDHLAEDLYREIFSLTNMVDLMVDELVDKDMSSHDGRWVEFEPETFEEGMEIENEILTSLVEELLGDIFVSKDL